jgi:hypothetical protein
VRLRGVPERNDGPISKPATKITRKLYHRACFTEGGFLEVVLFKLVAIPVLIHY